MNISSFSSVINKYQIPLSTFAKGSFGIAKIALGVHELYKLRNYQQYADKRLPEYVEEASRQNISDGRLFRYIPPSLWQSFSKYANKGVSYAYFLAQAYCVYTVFLNWNDPCSFARYFVQNEIFSLIKSKKTAEIIYDLSTSKVFSKLCLFQQLEKDEAVHSIQRKIAITAAFASIGIGLQNVVSAVNPLLQRAFGVSTLEDQTKDYLVSRYGEEILKFDAADKKDKMLVFIEKKVIDATDLTLYPIEKLMNEYDMKVSILHHANEIEHEVCQAVEMGNLKGIILTAHGSPQTIEIDGFPEALIHPNISRCFQKADPQASMFLTSCEAGKSSSTNLSPAEFFARIFNMKVVASSEVNSPGSLIIENINPLDIRYTTPYPPWKDSTVIYEPGTGKIIPPTFKASWWRGIKDALNVVQNRLRT